MASPNVAGTLLLLQQHANNLNGNFMRAATLKGLALHTADDAGPTGPDPVYGWGLLNAKRAAEALSADGNASQISELTLSSGQTYQITVDSDGVNDLIASVSWTDPAGTATTALNSSTPRLVNDLDIRVSQGGTTYTPWLLTGVTTNGKGDNIVDPYERVDVANASGSYTITVSHKGSLSGGSQNYSLIITGLSSTPVVCNATTPDNVTVAAFADTTATITWNPVPGASYTLRYKETSNSTWTTMAVGGNSANLTGLTPETAYEVQVRSECPDNSTSAYSSSVNFTTTEIQLNYCSSASTNTSDEYISRVQLNTIDNTSGAQFYSNFTNISTPLTQGQSYTITVTPTWTGTIYAEGYSVWIDYNKDGDFADAGEQVWTRSATTATPVSGSFTIPAGTVLGNTRMRVTMQYNAIPAACGSFTYGEVEDYTVNLQGNAPDTEKPVITLNGESPVSIEQGDSYTDAGATASDNVDGDLTSEIVVGGDTVDTSLVGTYVITYNVTDAAGNAADEVSRTVNVTADSTPPVITRIGSAIVNVNLGDTYIDEGATATDNFDGDITSNIVTVNPVDTSVEGTYIVTYNVTDAAGNAADEVTRTVNVAPDTTPPVITLVGSPTVDVNVGDTYNDEGATAVDNVDGDITSAIVTVNPVDTSIVGTYVVTYNVSDSAGNAADEVTRTVNVNADTTPPVITLIGSPIVDVNVGDTYNDAGATASDNVDGDITSNIVTVNPVNTSVEGSYIVTYNVSDAAGNAADEVTRTVNVNAVPNDVVLNQGFFENGWDGWTDGGSDCSRKKDNNRSYEGSYSIMLRDNSGVASSMTLSNVNLTPYAEVTVDFYFFVNSMENNEDFWLRYFNGSNWSTVAVWRSGDNINNNTFYNASVVLTASQFNFAANSGFRFQNDASGNNDQIFIDQVTITASTTAGNTQNSINALQENYVANASSNEFGDTDDDFVMYPNPVSGHTLNIKLFDNYYENISFEVVNMLGQTLLEGKLEDSRINVSSLNAGVYFIKINDGDEVMVRKFIKR